MHAHASGMFISEFHTFVKWKWVDKKYAWLGASIEYICWRGASRSGCCDDEHTSYPIVAMVIEPRRLHVRSQVPSRASYCHSISSLVLRFHLLLQFVFAGRFFARPQNNAEIILAHHKFSPQKNPFYYFSLWLLFLKYCNNVFMVFQQFQIS